MKQSLTAIITILVTLLVLSLQEGNPKAFEKECAKRGAFYITNCQK